MKKIKKNLKKKTKAKKAGIPYVYNRKWRDPRDLKIPNDVKPVIRFKSKISGNSIVKDHVQGEINILNSIMDDICFNHLLSLLGFFSTLAQV